VSANQKNLVGESHYGGDSGEMTRDVKFIDTGISD